MSMLSPTAQGSTSQSQNHPPHPTSALYVAINLATYEPANLEVEAPLHLEIELEREIVFRRHYLFATLDRSFLLRGRVVSCK